MGHGRMHVAVPISLRGSVLRSFAGAVLALIAAMFTSHAPAHAQRVDNAVAVFATLDKVTARISKIEVRLNQTAEFGSLKVTPRACYSRAPTEPPKTSGFVEVDETLLDGQQKRIFSGWMFAESPGLNAVEHPVFDVWLTECAQPTRPAQAAASHSSSPARGQPGPAPKGAGATSGWQTPTTQPADPDAEEPQPRRRVRR